MKVQKIWIDEKGYYLYILLNDDYEIVKSVEKYIRFLENTGKAQNTIKTYCYNLKLFFEYLSQINKGEFEVKLEDLVEFIGWLRNPTEKVNVFSIVPHIAKRSESTVNLVINTVLGFYSYMDRLGLYKGINKVYSSYNGPKKYKDFLHHINKSKSGIKNILKLREQKKLIKTISKEEAKTLFDACKTKRDKLILMIMYEGGLRVGETLGLRHEDIITWDNKIKVVCRRNNINEAYPKSRNERVVDVSKQLMSLYTDYIINEYDENYESDYVFIKNKGVNCGEPLRYHSVLDLFGRLSKKTNIKITPHILRHSHATDLIRNGWDPSYVQKRLGHANVQTTLDTYLHLSNDDMKKKFSEYLEQVGDLDE